MNTDFQRTGTLRFLVLIFALGAIFTAATSWAATTNTVTISVTPSAVNSFSPQDALGAGIDILFGDANTTVYSAGNVSNMLAAGHGMLSYRLNSELGVQDWHWNPTGTWSDPSGGGKGYFAGSTNLSGSIQHSYVYELPHRGITTDQTGSSRYSVLTDNNSSTYWKSHPYLSSTYTGDADSLHPQWVMVDIGSATAVNAVRLVWANPYAVKYQVQYWTGSDAINTPQSGTWTTFSQGTVTSGAGGTVTLAVSPSNISARFVRVLMTQSSGTFDTHGTGDPRNAMGYALAEIYVGTLVGSTFTDKLTHSPDQNQSPTYVSSTDPWHAAANETSPSDEEQPGLDFIFTNGITRGLPTMVPVPMIYSTPENAAAEMAYLKARGYPVSYVELGEEPDGQYMTPEDYAALYLQWATAIHQVDASFKLGGPVFAEGATDVKTWADGSGETSWLKRFVNYLSVRGRANDLSFMSFEHYPNDPCVDPWASLKSEPTIVSNILATWRNDGVPSGTPIFCTEYNFSYDFTASEPSLVGALWQADFVGSFLERGGNGAYYYQYEAYPLYKASGCNSYGSFSMFKSDVNLQASTKLSQFYSSQLINTEWAQAGRQLHYVFPAHSDLVDGSGNELVSAYALFRPDGKWSVMLINKDNAAQHYVHLQFSNTVTHAVTPVTGAADFFQFTSAQYNWVPNAANGTASPNLPPAQAVITNASTSAVLLASGSLNLVRTAGPTVSSCASNKTVSCGSAWTFDPPTFAGPCANTNVTVTVTSTVTNGICPQTITRFWLVSDACGNTNTCSQAVTVVDTVPPVLVCPTNKVVPPGASWSFDAPTASDDCSGSNVSVAVLGTISNGVCPLVVTRTWVATDACGNTNTCSQSVTITDTVNPTVVVKSPIFGTQSATPLPVNGTASDDIGVDHVLSRVNGGAWTPVTTANGFANWSTTINLVGGANTFDVQSFDACGNGSALVSRAFFLTVPTPFTLITNGFGDIGASGGLYGKPVDGASLQVGRIYTLTAKPAPNNVFSNWQSVYNGVTTVVGTDTKLQFTMLTNLTIVANFATNSFTGIAGTYNGLFNDTVNGVAHESAGFIVVNVTASSTKPAAYSGHFLLDGESLPFSGRFTAPGDGTPKKAIPRKGKASLTLNLHIPFDSSERMTGTISNLDDGWVSSITAYRAPFNKTNLLASSFVGTYTMVLPGYTNTAVRPGGDGFGYVSIATNGVVKLAGNLGDGAAFTQTAKISRHGLWPLYASAYPVSRVYTNGGVLRTFGARAGSSWGWVTVAPNSAGLSGVISWMKKPDTNDDFYVDGFSNAIALVASPYTNLTLVGQSILPFNGGSGVASLAFGNLSSPFQNTFTLPSLNKFVVNSGADKLKITITAKTGKITGTFLHPDNDGATTHFYGTALQRSNAAYGWFKGTNQSGSIILQGN